MEFLSEEFGKLDLQSQAQRSYGTTMAALSRAFRTDSYHSTC
jgi:hypothetical protein